MRAAAPPEGPFSTAAMLVGARRLWQRCGVDTERGALMGDPKNILILLLLVAVGVLGYLYYDSQQTQVRIDVPGFKLEAK
jgi:hypothetical protein